MISPRKYNKKKQFPTHFMANIILITKAGENNTIKDTYRPISTMDVGQTCH